MVAISKQLRKSLCQKLDKSRQGWSRRRAYGYADQLQLTAERKYVRLKMLEQDLCRQAAPKM